MTQWWEPISRSIAHSEIVTVPWSQELEDDLAAQCDGSADNGAMLEYWGTDDLGYDWRVHLERGEHGK